MRREALILGVILITVPVMRVCAQTLNITTVAGVLHLKVAGFSFLTGQVLDRLKEGRAVRVDFEVSVLSRPKGLPVARGRQSFNLSFDIWEERLAVTQIGTPASSVSHLRAPDAEAWCLERLTLPLASLGRYGRDEPFWLKLEYRIPQPTPAAEGDGQPAISLQRLIDRLSQSGEKAAMGRTLEAGPFRVSN